MRKPDIAVLKSKTRRGLTATIDRFRRAEAVLPSKEYLLLRWTAAMTAVEVHAIWERYAERRLMAALAIHPAQLISDNGILGLKHVPIGLAEVIVRGGGRYADLRSFEDLLGKATRLLGRTHNPFLAVPNPIRAYLDGLAAVRNYIVHRSHASSVSYRAALKRVYGIKSVPDVDEFLNAIDYRSTSMQRGQKRIIGLIYVVSQAVATS
jgi:hypothetical protein